MSKQSQTILVTGGAGFIGRWLVKRLLEDGHQVWVLDNLSNGLEENLYEFKNIPNFKGLVVGDIKDDNCLKQLFKNKFDICFHLAAGINVQDSIDNPKKIFEDDVVGTFNVLEQCKKHWCKMVFMSTCMVYEQAVDKISETHPVKPASPYAGAKLAGESMVLSYWYAYGLPTVIIRPFNTYGPFQKTNNEGGVVAVFIMRNLKGEDLYIYGDGTQTRDLLYVEDCVDFIVKAGFSEKANGQIINAGLGKDISINDLAKMICNDPFRIKHVPHIHPQSEIHKLLCDNSKANHLLNWFPKVPLEEGIKRTEEWIKMSQK